MRSERSYPRTAKPEEGPMDWIGRGACTETKQPRNGRAESATTAVLHACQMPTLELSEDHCATMYDVPLAGVFTLVGRKLNRVSSGLPRFNTRSLGCVIRRCDQSLPMLLF